MQNWKLFWPLRTEIQAFILQVTKPLFEKVNPGKHIKQNEAKGNSVQIAGAKLHRNSYCMTRYKNEIRYNSCVIKNIYL